MQQPPPTLVEVEEEGASREAKWAAGVVGEEEGGARIPDEEEEGGHATTYMRASLRRSGSRKARRLEWNVGDFTVKLRHKRTLNILHNIVGRAEAGTLSAIMGPSGCGKTSLLDCIALRNKSFTGTLRLDGKPLTGSYFLDTGGWVRWARMVVD
jgi:ABC-type glutathione transport system ATPase component